MDIPSTINETRYGLLSKKYKVVDLINAYLAKIARYDGEINSFITVCEENAYKGAKKADALISELGEKAFQDYPLLGCVVAHKDVFITEGIRTTAASKVLDSYVPCYSATAVKRLDDAGAICIGKLNCDAWAHGSSGENSQFGATKNPWNLEYVPGGSSSGSGAALAADFCLLSTGTDTCGSVRLPSNYCGVVGLKPTYGAISRYGVIAMASSLDTVGPMAKTVEDVEMMFKVLSGPDAKDATIASVKYQSKSSSFKIGIPKEFFGEGLDDEVRNNLDSVIQIYKKLGVDFVDVSLPSTKYAISVYYVIQPAEVSSNLARYDGIRYGNSRDAFGDEAKRRIMLGTYVLSSGYYDAYYLKAMKVRTLIRKEVSVVFEKVDAVIAPVAPTPPFKIGAKANDPLQMYLTDIYAATANLSGIPSIAIPSGFTKNGLPLGFQLMGPRFSESLLFDLGKKYHKEISYKPSVAKL
ncbi:MAG: Asp-tRNA(Asn)/Glu-tRNA(Gln) amidotransferase subunit GatA [Patescibacteria group bacterium]|nr:Asp-tRNA(Asn)/Glu-tRNA(Gln) amidotransferase subunit GatA [Patescibacteria group bacterium]